MLRSQGEALFLFQAAETPTWNPEHEQARYSLALDFGFQSLPLLGAGPGLFAPLFALTSSQGSAAAVGFPRLCRSGMPAPRSSAGADPSSKKASIPVTKRGDQHFTWAILSSLLLQSLLNGRRQGPSTQTYSPLIFLKLISCTVLGSSL